MGKGKRGNEVIPTLRVERMVLTGKCWRNGIYIWRTWCLYQKTQVLSICNHDIINYAKVQRCHFQLISNASNLPSNTLLTTLSPPGQTFYLPSSHTSHSRSPTPSVGYTSDPESEVRKVKQGSDHLLAAAGSSGPAVDVVALSRRRHRRGAGVTSESTRDTAKTAGWQDLFKCVLIRS